jgi:hypothetical protein
MHPDQTNNDEDGSIPPPLLPADPEATPLAVPKASIWAKARQTLAEASTQASSAGAAAVSKAASVATPVTARASEIGKQTIVAASAAIGRIDSELEQRGAKQAAKDTAGAVLDKLDQVTGKRLLELLEERLAAQDVYNNVLATRLAEALERIAQLEARIGDRSNDD